MYFITSYFNSSCMPFKIKLYKHHIDGKKHLDKATMENKWLPYVGGFAPSTKMSLRCISLRNTITVHEPKHYAT